MKFIKVEKDEIELSNEHFEYCMERNIPFITISDNENYSILSYDLLPCRSIFSGDNELHKAILSFYKVYVLKYNFEDLTMAGGISSSGMHVHKNHANDLAEFLFDFILSYIETTKEWYQE